MNGKDLSSIIKRARDIMRKDAGLSTDVDRIPQLSWILFLKAFDDLEKERALLNQKYREAIEAPYRWRDWAAEEEKGLTGDELIDFVNNKQFPYLRSLIGTDEKDQRTVIAEVFREIYNSMRSGYLLRDVIDLVNGIDFTSSDDIHTMAHLYESMLKEMRDAAGSNGEFYTPRPVIRFIVGQIKPQIGEKILDPALGTGGFLTESYEFMKGQQKRAEDRAILQYQTFLGIEKKPMPYLLGMMNLVLHGIEKPNIRRENALRIPIYEITEKDRVNVIMTNPPFGGEEEKGIMQSFPEVMRTSETALLFIQYIMRKLKNGGRCGMVVPDGILSSMGVGQRIKQELIENFNLHTIVRLPEGVFAPYTDIPTNLLFFDKDGKTKSDFWYYELSLPPDRKKYTKTMPLKYEEFRQCMELWDSRAESANSWIVKYDYVAKMEYNLDIKNPHKTFTYESKEPIAVTNEFMEKINSLKNQLATFETDLIGFRKSTEKFQFEMMNINSFAKQVKRIVDIEPNGTYTFLGISSSGKGLFKKKAKNGNEIKADKGFLVKKGDFIYSRLFARLGSFAVAEEEHDGCLVSGEFPVFELNLDAILPDYLFLYFSLPSVWSYVEGKCQGTTKASRFRFKEKFFLDMKVPVPKKEIQERIIALARTLWGLSQIEGNIVKTHEGLALSFLASVFKEHVNCNARQHG